MFRSTEFGAVLPVRILLITEVMRIHPPRAALSRGSKLWIRSKIDLEYVFIPQSVMEGLTGNHFADFTSRLAASDSV